MPSVIKAGSHQSSTNIVAFNFDDMAAQADRFLGQIRGEAEKVIVSAKSQVADVLKRAEQDGLQKAKHSMNQQLDQLLAQRMETLTPAVSKAVQEIQEAKQAFLSNWERNLVKLASAIAKRVIRRELSKTPDITLAWIREALELAAGSSGIVLKINPQDEAALGAQVKLLVSACSKLGNVEVVADAAITPGGCRVETQFGSVDEQIETQLNRIEQELST